MAKVQAVGLEPWDQWHRQGYCYHSVINRYKTDKLIIQLRAGPSAKKLATIAYELSFRDPALALNEVQALANNPVFAKRKKALRLCLHHVADAVTARSLFLEDDFDPDALHLSAFTTLLDDYQQRLPQLNATDAEAQLRKLGFLSSPAPSVRSFAPCRAPTASAC